MEIDKTVPVSRADYDAMADQRDAFRRETLDLKTELKWRRALIDFVVAEINDVGVSATSYDDRWGGVMRDIIKRLQAHDVPFGTLGLDDDFDNQPDE